MVNKDSEIGGIQKDLNDDTYVSRAYREQRSFNIEDAYGDPDFNRALDRHTGYRTKSVLVAPIRINDKVEAVIECVNKVSTRSSVFEKQDDFLLHVIGYAAVDVVNKCQKHNANTQTSKRKDMLLEAAEELFQKCSEVKDLYRMLTDRMHQMFRASEMRIVLCCHDKLIRLDVDLDGCTVEKDYPILGLAGEVAEGKKFAQFLKK